MQKKYFELKKKIDKLKAEVEKQYQAAFSELCKDFFAKYPNVHSFRWNQYTPYFNDGDVCYFNRYQTEVRFNTKVDEDYDEEEYIHYSGNKEIKAILAECEQLVEMFDNSDLETMFGDGVTVCVYPDRVDTEDCSDHD